MKTKKSIWTRDLSEFPIVQLGGTLAIIAGSLYGLWGTFTGHLTLGRSGEMHYYGTQARLLGFFLFSSLSLLLLATMMSESLNPRRFRAVSILAILSFVILIMLLMIDLLEIV